MMKWEEAEYIIAEFIQDVLEEGDMAIDIGANPTSQGPGHTDAMAKHVGEEGRVIAFDPFPTRELEDIAARDNIDLISDAVADEPIHLKEGEMDCGGGFIGSRVYAGNIALDESSINPKLIKIDVEGYEWMAVKSGMSMIERARPYLCIEIHEYKERSLGATQELIEYLLDLGYTITSVQKDEEVNEYSDLVRKPKHLEHIIAEP